MKFAILNILLFIAYLGECKPGGELLGVESILGHDYVDCPVEVTETTPKFTTIVERRGRFLKTTEENFIYPAIGASEKKISCIIVRDLTPNGKGGWATVYGSIGDTTIRVNLRSQLGQGISFRITIYTEDKKSG